MSDRLGSRVDFPLERDAEGLIALGKLVAVEGSEFVLERAAVSKPSGVPSGSVSESMSTGSTRVMWI